MDCKPQDLEEKPYDPFENRIISKPNSDFRSFVNLLKASLGLGLFAMPSAFAASGWGFGIIGTIFIAFICTFSIHLLVKTSQKCCRLDRKPMLSYAETCESAFKNGLEQIKGAAGAVSVFIEIAISLTFGGVCCVFVILIAEQAQQLLGAVYKEYASVPIELYCLMLIFPLGIICQIKHLKWLAPFSLLANGFVLGTFIICLYYTIGAVNAESFEDKPFMGKIGGLPTFLSTVIFAIEGFGVVMPVENAMKKPQHFLGFPGVLSLCMVVIVVLYTTLGLCGYLMFGDKTETSIVKNLPLDEWPAICAKCFLIFNIFLGYPLHFYIVMEIFTKYTRPYIAKKHENVVGLVSRLLIVALSAIIAACVPMLKEVISLIGALFYSLLGVIVPGVVDSVLHWNKPSSRKWSLLRNTLLILYGLFTMVTGCHDAIKEIIHNWHE